MAVVASNMADLVLVSTQRKSVAAQNRMARRPSSATKSSPSARCILRQNHHPPFFYPSLPSFPSFHSLTSSANSSSINSSFSQLVSSSVSG